MADKKTIKEAFAEVKVFLENANAPQAMIDFIEDRAEKSVRKSTDRKPTEQQTRNEEIAEEVFDYLEETGEKLQAKDMIKKIPCFIELSKTTYVTTQFVTAILRKLYDKKRPAEDNRIQRLEIKGKTYFCKLGLEVEA